MTAAEVSNTGRPQKSDHHLCNTVDRENGSIAAKRFMATSGDGTSAIGRHRKSFDTTAPLHVHEAQQIAQSIVGAVQWEGAEGLCACPGIHRHMKCDAATDCKVVCEPLAKDGGTLKPGVYCFHGSCSEEVAMASRDLRSALGKRGLTARTRPSPQPAPVRPRQPQFDPAALERIARKLDGADADWFAGRSPKCVNNRTPASFLHELYHPGESVIVFDRFRSQGQVLWTREGPPFDAGELDSFRTGKPNGVWYLCNPVSGAFAPTGKFNKDGSAHFSCRTWRSITRWPYLVLESDKADQGHWLAALAQLPLPIAAVYTSGGASIHALVRTDADSQAHWNEIASDMKPTLVMLGADQKAISAVRLTRLPCCERLGITKTDGAYIQYPQSRLQRLLYLNGNPDVTPICERRACP
jgi:hypothetical protein